MKEAISIRNCTFAFRCKANWNEMMPTRDDGTVRFCLDCMTEVFFCKSDAELADHVKWNHCIAITRMVKGREFTLLGDIRPRKKSL